MEKFFNPEMLSTLTAYALNVLGALILLLVALWGSNVVKRMTFRGLERSRLDMTLTKFFSTSAKWTVLVIGGVSILGMFGVETASFAAVLAAAGFAVGLAFQGTLSNFSAGVMLLVFRPFKVGQFVKAAGVAGTVVEIELFSTIMDTPDNRRIIVPNSAIFGSTIENVSHHATRRVDLTVGTDYAASLAEVRTVLEEVAKGVDGVLTDPPFQIVLSELGASSVDWTLRLWVKSEDYWSVRETALEAIKKALDEASIGIPFPQMDVNLVGDLLAKQNAE